MKKAMLVGLLASLVAALVTGPARAAEEARSKAYIILVGVSDYADKQIKPRKHAEADAKALYDLFTDQNIPGRAITTNIKLLLGTQDAARSSEPATKANILKAIDWAVKKAGKDDLVVFAFFGQGGPLGERTCLFGSDATIKDRAKNAVAAGDIEKELEHLKSQRFVAFIDINFKGFDASKENVAEPNPLDLYKVFLGDDEKDDHQPLPGRVVFLATNGLKQSLDLAKHGLFATALLDGLKGAADNEGYEPCGVVTIDGLTQYLDKQIPELARANGKTHEEKEQQHHVLGSAQQPFRFDQQPGRRRQGQGTAGQVCPAGQGQEAVGGDCRGRPAAVEPDAQAEGPAGAAQGLHEVRGRRRKQGRLPEGARRHPGRNEAQAGEAIAYANKMMRAIGLLKEQLRQGTEPGRAGGLGSPRPVSRLDEKKIADDVKGRLDKPKELTEAQLAHAPGRRARAARQAGGPGQEQGRGHLAASDDAPPRPVHQLHRPRERRAASGKDTDANFTGIGIQIRKDNARDELLVVTPIKGSPAYKAGLKAGDIITKIIREMDSKGDPLQPPEVIPTKGLLLSDAVDKILGKPGTEVKMTVEREGVDKPLEFAITRGAIQVETVMGVKRKDQRRLGLRDRPGEPDLLHPADPVRRNSFRDMRKVVAALSEQEGGIKGLVLDLRFNPGGLLHSAVEISDLFIDDGLIVTIRPRVGREHSFSGEHDGSYLNFPMVCLVNSGSASGSEIVSACLQDHKRAIIIGERSYGKGSVQNIMDFKPTGGQIKLTTASFWRPSGKNLNKSSTKGTESETWGVTAGQGLPHQAESQGARRLWPRPCGMPRSSRAATCRRRK